MIGRVIRFVRLPILLILIFAALRVITVRNLVHAALWLVLSFFTAAALWLLLQAEFLAIALVLVYVGAVMVLFLFVVMMLDIDVEKLRAGFRSYIPVGATVGILILFEMMLDINTAELRRGFWSHFPLAALVGVLIALEMALVLLGGFRGVQPPVADAMALKLGNTRMLGIEVYTNYLYPLQVAAVLLLVAIIAAIALTHRKRRQTKYQNPSEQLRVRRDERLRILNIPAEKREP